MEKTNDNAAVQPQEVAPGYTVEEIRAMFFNADALTEPPYRVFQLNTEGYRYYYRFNQAGEPVFYPSVTTLLKQVMPTSPQLIEWMIANGKEGSTEKRDLAAAYGTFMHIQFEQLIINRRYDFDAVPAVLSAYMQANNLPEKFYAENLTKARKDVLAFAQFVRDYNVRPLAVEIGLVHPEGGYAGCIDLPCMMTDPKTGEAFRAIVDFKSGRKGFYEEHELQLHLYREMWNVNYPDKPISRVFNFSPKDWRIKPTYNLKEQTQSENAPKIPYLLKLAAIADANRDHSITVVRGVLNLDEGAISDNYVTLSLAEIIKARIAENTPAKPAEVPEKTEAPTPKPGVVVRKPRMAPKTSVNEPEPPKVINTTTESQNALKNDFSDKLPWEDDEPAPQADARENLLNSEIDL